MKKRFNLFLLVVLAVSIFGYGVGYSLGEEKETAFENLEIFAEGIATVEEKYVKEEKLKDLIYG
ncbi:MAG: hypothetical protein K9L71_03130, partial [Candidatus Omnitrophica bacterium]|nr:hypothetical protein [Candidatus Omnitrophota bacterium]